MHRILVFSLLCFIALCAGLYITLPHIEVSIGSFSSAIQEITTPAKTSVPKTEIRFVGDIMLARNVEYLMNTFGYDYPFSILPPVAEHMYAVGNFEGSVPSVHVPTKSMQFAFSVRPDYLRGLFEAGFTHLGLANNHSYDFGASEYDNTVEVLGNQFTVFGNQIASAQNNIARIELATGTVALIGVYAVDVPPSPEEITVLFEQANATSDVQVAYVHWGTEYQPKHSQAQERLAQQLIDAGADVVVGHHPHVVQDIGLYKGVPIFYSLGNFIFDQYFSPEVQNGLMVDMDVQSDALYFTLHPVTSIGSRSQTRLSGLFERSEALEELALKSSASLQTTIREGYVTTKRITQ